jgi:hypothetical protein
MPVRIMGLQNKHAISNPIFKDDAWKTISDLE